jgi:hypothetical protein
MLNMPWILRDKVRYRCTECSYEVELTESPFTRSSGEKKKHSKAEYLIAGVLGLLAIPLFFWVKSFLYIKPGNEQAVSLYSAFFCLLMLAISIYDFWKASHM